MREHYKKVTRKKYHIFIIFPGHLQLINFLKTDIKLFPLFYKIPYKLPKRKR